MSGELRQTQVRNMKYFCSIVHFCPVSLVGIVSFHLLFFSFFALFFVLFFFLRWICKHFVKMYILGMLFFYAIGMLFNALFKLSLLYFFNWLDVVAQQTMFEVINTDWTHLCVCGFFFGFFFSPLVISPHWIIGLTAVRKLFVVYYSSY